MVKLSLNYSWHILAFSKDTIFWFDKLLFCLRLYKRIFAKVRHFLAARLLYFFHLHQLLNVLKGRALAENRGLLGTASQNCSHHSPLVCSGIKQLRLPLKVRGIPEHKRWFEREPNISFEEWATDLQCLQHSGEGHKGNTPLVQRCQSQFLTSRS